MSISNNDVNEQIDDIFSYLCQLALSKCGKKSEKKRAQCGGHAMRKRVLIKNFVTKILDKDHKVTCVSSGEHPITRELRHQLKHKIRSLRTEEELEEQEQDESEEEEYTELVPVDEGVEEDHEEEEDFEEESEADDSLDMPSFDSHTDLPDIQLDMDPPRHYLSNQYLGYECEDMTQTSDLDDCLADSFDMSGVPMNPSYTTSNVSMVTPAPSSAAPSWRESEPDLYMMEGSRRYYDDYHTVPARDYLVDDLSSVHENSMYPMCEQFMISSMPSMSNQTYSSSQAMCMSNQTSPIALPENFMEDPSLADINPPTTMPMPCPATNGQTPCTCVSQSYDSSVMSNSQPTLSSLMVTNSVTAPSFMSGVVSEEERTEHLIKRDDHSTAFVDLINVCSVPTKMSCRLEVSDSHYRQHYITDLDTQMTVVEKYDFGHSRKRSATLDCNDGSSVKRFRL